MDISFHYYMQFFYPLFKFATKRELKTTLTHKNPRIKWELYLNLIAYGTSPVWVKFNSQSENGKNQIELLKFSCLTKEN